MAQHDLLSAFTQRLNKLCSASALATADFHIALSGGLDSVVLLHLFARLREQHTAIQVSAHHINHGLSVNAASWEAFCRQLCTALAIDFSCSAVCLDKQNRTSLEALARDKRYQCLTRGLTSNSYLVSAHHQDDQLETVLLALKRGSGNTGLQGIRHQQPLINGYLIRPLLDFSRQQLALYAQDFELNWIEDESNRDQVFDRNFIRHSISPLLKTRWPAIAKTVARSAAICQEQQQLLDEIAELDFTHCVTYLLNQNILKVNELKLLTPARRNNLLRYWFKHNQLRYPSAKQLGALWEDLVLAADHASPLMTFQGVSLRRYRNHLYLLAAQAAVDIGQPVRWQGEAQISLLAGTLKLNFAVSREGTDALVIPENAQVVICFRAHLPTKLACTPIGRNGSRSIKKLLHEYHVPPWLRDTVPFVLVNGELQQAVGLWQCQTATADRDSQYLAVTFA